MSPLELIPKWAESKLAKPADRMRAYWTAQAIESARIAPKKRGWPKGKSRKIKGVIE